MRADCCNGVFIIFPAAMKRAELFRWFLNNKRFCHAENWQMWMRLVERATRKWFSVSEVRADGTKSIAALFLVTCLTLFEGGDWQQGGGGHNSTFRPRGDRISVPSSRRCFHRNYSMRTTTRAGDSTTTMFPACNEYGTKPKPNERNAKHTLGGRRKEGL